MLLGSIVSWEVSTFTGKIVFVGLFSDQGKPTSRGCTTSSLASTSAFAPAVRAKRGGISIVDDDNRIHAVEFLRRGWELQIHRLVKDALDRKSRRIRSGDGQAELVARYHVPDNNLSPTVLDGRAKMNGVVGGCARGAARRNRAGAIHEINAVHAERARSPDIEIRCK